MEPGAGSLLFLVGCRVACSHLFIISLEQGISSWNRQSNASWDETSLSGGGLQSTTVEVELFTRLALIIRVQHVSHVQIFLEYIYIWATTAQKGIFRLALDYIAGYYQEWS